MSLRWRFYVSSDLAVKIGGHDEDAARLIIDYEFNIDEKSE